MSKHKLTALQLLNPLQWTKWSAAFALNWSLSRPDAKFLSAVPAIIAGVGLVAVILVSTTEHPQARASRYRTNFDDFIHNRDYCSASLVLRSLIDNSPQNRELQYQQALLKELLGNMELAMDFADD